jgi:PAS domain S-box-containing protein
MSQDSSSKGTEQGHAVKAVPQDSRGPVAEQVRRMAELQKELAQLEEQLGLRIPQPSLSSPGQEMLSLDAYRLIIELSVDFISLHAPNGHYLFVSPNVERLFGWKPEQILGHPAYEFIHEADWTQVADNHAHHLEQRPETPPVRYRLRCAGGGYRWVETRSQSSRVPGGVGRIVSITRDIHAQVLAEQERATAERESLLRRLSFLAQAGVTLATSLDYQETLEHLLQLAVPFLADWCAVDILQPDGTVRRRAVVHMDAQRTALAWEMERRYPLDLRSDTGVAQVLRSGQPVLTENIPESCLVDMARDAGHLRFLRGLGMRSSLLLPLVARGRVMGCLSLVYAESGRRYGEADLRFCEDLARRAALALDAASLYREAQDAIRLREEFLSIASHELKTPLTPLQLRLGTLARLARRASGGPLPAEQVAREVALAQQQVTQISELISHLLDVTRIRAGQLKVHLEEVDLCRVVREVVARFSSQAEQVGCPLVLQVEGTLTGLWDALRLEQVVTNLVTNALKYAPGQPIVVRVWLEGEEACLTVRDEGMGITPELLSRLFERFERGVSDQHQGGLGLGLYITRRIVEALGGSIRVTSEPQRGALFTVRLPRHGVVPASG